MHCWYWLADTCRDHQIAFVLGHAWAMRAVHGSKTKCDRLEAEIEGAARGHYRIELAVLQTTPGVGPVLSLTVLLEVDTIDRFATRQQFCSYARRCGAVQQPAGRRTGLGNRKAGSAWLKGAFSEAAVLSAPKDERIGGLLQRLAS